MMNLSLLALLFISSTIYEKNLDAKRLSDISMLIDSSGYIDVIYSRHATDVSDYYVSPSGNDNNPGTKNLPWRTIQKAANTIAPGKTAVIKAGNYNEFVKIKRSGTSNNTRIKLYSETSHGASCLGFKIEGSYITIDGFNIEAFQPNYTGIEVPGYSNVDILNCYVHECPLGGIRVSHGSTNVKVIGNKLEHNGQYGIGLSGSNGLIENNFITKTVQYHSKGLPPGSRGADADGIRIFGSNHIIRGNSVINIAEMDDKGNIDPHADCIQSWDSNGYPVITNSIIEKNYFSVSCLSGKGIILETKGSPCHEIIIRNNIIEFRDIGVAATYGKFYNIYIYNNVFKAKLNDKVWGVAYALKNVTNYKVLNNITVDCHPEHRKIIGGTGIVDYNLMWNSDNSRISLEPGVQAHELNDVNPKFVNYTTDYGINNYQLQSGSPAINSGKVIPENLEDFNGKVRKAGTACDIGAYESK